MEYIQQVTDNCGIEAILLNHNEKAKLFVNISENPIQKAWIGKKAGDILTTPTGLSYRIEKIYIGETEEVKAAVPRPQKPSRKRGEIQASAKKKNSELNNEFFDYDLSGFAMYLFKRGYSSFATSGANSTCLGYSDAITKICLRENLNFRGLCQNIREIANEYSLDGRKRKQGENGHGTWRNALKRLEEFVEYQEKYLKQQQ